MKLPERVPPSYSDLALQVNCVTICGVRGYHGPFINEKLYDAFGGMWAGQGDCFYCYSTRNVKAEQANANRVAA